MIMQTKIVDRPEVKVGDYMLEKSETGHKQYLLQREKARKVNKKRNSDPNFCVDQFDYDEYMNQVEKEKQDDIKLLKQMQEHERLA